MRQQVEESKKAIQQVFQHTSVPTIGSCLPPCTNNITVHFAFDFAQQVCYTQQNNTGFTLIFFLGPLPS